MTSAAFQAAIAGSHRVAGTCVVAGTTTLVVDASSSSVSIDWTQSPTRTCDLTLMDPTGTLTPSDATSLLHPLSGNEFVVSLGVQFDDGTQELLSLGVFGIKTSQVDDSGGDLVIKVTGADRAYAMSRAKLSSIYPLTAGVDLGTTIQTLLAAQVPSTLFNFTAVSYLMPPGQVLVPGDDPWAQAKSLAADAGCLLDFDANGVCYLIPMPDPTVQAIAATYLEGPTCTVTGGTRLLTNIGVFSHTIREGSGSTIGAPVRGEWMDTNPLSATYWQGSYGDVVDYQTSSLWTTAAQAQAVAQADGVASLGTAEAATLTIVTDPSRLPLDVVQVQRSRMNINSYYVIDALSIPLGAGTDMQMNGRLVHR